MDAAPPVKTEELAVGSQSWDPRVFHHEGDSAAWDPTAFCSVDDVVSANVISGDPESAARTKSCVEAKLQDKFSDKISFEIVPYADLRVHIAAILEKHHHRLVDHIVQAMKQQERALAALVTAAPAISGFESERRMRYHESYRSRDTSESVCGKSVTPEEGSELDMDQSISRPKSRLSSSVPSYDAAMSTRLRIAEQKSQRMRSTGTREELSRKELMLKSKFFELFFFFLLVSNSLLIGAEVQYRADHSSEPSPIGFTICRYIYTTVFLLELSFRIYCLGWRFLKKPDRLWNLLDALVVLASLCEIVIDAVAASAGSRSDATNISSIRVVRLVRISRLIRTLRIASIIRFVTGLRTLIYSILLTLRSLIWALVLLVIIMYVFAIIFTQLALDSLANCANPDGGLVTYWSSLFRSLLTLFMSISGGLNWDDVYQPLSRISLPIAFIYLMYISFTYFAVLNVVTGIFCHSAIETASRDPDLVVQSLVDSRLKYVENLRQLFLNVDADGSGSITIDEFRKVLQDRSKRAHFAALQLDVDDPWAFFRLLDEDQDCVVKIDEFINGCLKLSGSAKAADIALLREENRWLSKKLSKFINRMDEHIKIGESLARASARQLSKMHSPFVSTSTAN